jgi:hypothetical protein
MKSTWLQFHAHEWKAYEISVLGWGEIVWTQVEKEPMHGLRVAICITQMRLYHTCIRRTAAPTRFIASRCCTLSRFVKWSSSFKLLLTSLLKLALLVSRNGRRNQISGLHPRGRGKTWQESCDHVLEILIKWCGSWAFFAWAPQLYGPNVGFLRFYDSQWTFLCLQASSRVGIIKSHLNNAL